MAFCLLFYIGVVKFSIRSSVHGGGVVLHLVFAWMSFYISLGLQNLSVNIRDPVISREAADRVGALWVICSKLASISVPHLQYLKNSNLICPHIKPGCWKRTLRKVNLCVREWMCDLGFNKLCVFKFWFAHKSGAWEQHHVTPLWILHTL